MLNSEKTEQFRHQETIEFDFEHITHNHPEVRENPNFKPRLEKGGGICWAISMSEAISALSKKPSKEVLKDIGEITYNYFPNNIAEIQRRLREKHGTDGAIPFIEKGLDGLVDPRTGELRKRSTREFPKQTQNLFNLILQDSGYEDIRFEIVENIAKLDYNWWDELTDGFSENSLPVMCLRIDEENNDRRNTTYHMILISGIKTDEEGQIKGMKISDSNINNQFWLENENFNEFRYRGVTQNRQDGTKVTYSPDLEVRTLLWFKK
jgi:hypothetical protein